LGGICRPWIISSPSIHAGLFAVDLFDGFELIVFDLAEADQFEDILNELFDSLLNSLDHL
jgi:hypothetical protein